MDSVNLRLHAPCVVTTDNRYTYAYSGRLVGLCVGVLGYLATAPLSSRGMRLGLECV